RRAIRPGSSNRGERVSDRVVTEDATCSRGRPACRAAYAVDIRRRRLGEHPASHVVRLVVGVSGSLGGPGVGALAIFKRVNELVTHPVRAAPAHSIEVPGIREENASRTHDSKGRVGTWHPTWCATGISDFQAIRQDT